MLRPDPPPGALWGTAAVGATTVVVVKASDGVDLSAWTSIAIALVFGLAQLTFVRQQSRRNDVALLKDLREGWTGVRPAWEITRAALEGSGDFYAPHLDDQDRARLAALEAQLRELEAAHDAINNAIARKERSQPPGATPPQASDRQYARYSTASDSLREQTRWVQAQVNELQNYLGPVAELVLSGRVSVQVIYSIIGPYLVPFTVVIRSLARTGEAEAKFSTSSASDWLYFNGAGQRRLIVSLVDLLWAEAVRRGDLSPLTVQSVAEHKRRSGSGLAVRKRVHKQARLVKAGPLRAWSLSRSLKVAENPESLAIYSRLGDDWLTPPTDWPL